jgi:DnaJ domain
MIELRTGYEFSASLADAALLALWVVPPGLVLSYVRNAAKIRRTQPEFALRKSETAEWNRAVALYGRVRRQIDEIESRSTRPALVDRLLLGCDTSRAEADSETFADLQALAAHLRAAVVRLNRQPLDRLRSWIHMLSARFAVGYALGAYLVGFSLLIATAALSQRWTDPSASGGIALLLWCPLGPLVCANVVSIAFAALAGPVVYVLRRIHLRRLYRVEFLVLKDLTRAEPQQAIWRDESAEIDRNATGEVAAFTAADRRDWFEIFGLSPTASLDELRKAYKTLIKQNHPDRVHGMSPAFVKLAEAETRRLNVAYQEALVSLVPEAAGV